MKMKANAAPVTSTLGSGGHGLLVLTVSANTYRTIAGKRFQHLVYPSALPAIHPNQTGPQISKIVWQHKENLRFWREYNATGLTLIQTLLASFEEVYFKGLRNGHVGYQNSTFLQMIQHLYTNYGVITPTDLEDNDIHMRKPYDANKQIEELFDQIEDVVEYTDAANAAYSDT